MSDKKFVAFESRNEAELLFSREINSAVKRTTVRCCTPGKKCTGSIDGVNYMYSDGSKDIGVDRVKATVEIGGHRLAWMEDVGG